MNTTQVERIWPETAVADTDDIGLPLPIFEYSGEPRNRKWESKSNSLKIERRLRFTKVFPMASFSWIFTAQQYAAFVEFYSTALGMGTASFRIPLIYPENSALREWVVRFLGDGFSSKWMDGHWQVSASVELLTPHILDDAASLQDWQPYLSSDGFEYHSSEDYIYEATV